MSVKAISCEYECSNIRSLVDVHQGLDIRPRGTVPYSKMSYDLPKRIENTKDGISFFLIRQWIFLESLPWTLASSHRGNLYPKTRYIDQVECARDIVWEPIGNQAANSELGKASKDISNQRRHFKFLTGTFTLCEWILVESSKFDR